MRPAFVWRSLASLKARTEEGDRFVVQLPFEIRLSVICHENHQSIIPRLPLIQLVHQPTKVIVDILDHSVTSGRFLIVSKFRESLLVLFGGNHGTVRRIGSDVGQERFAGVELLFGPAQGRLKENVRAKSLCLNDGLVLKNDAIVVLVFSVGGKVGTTPRIGLSDSARTVNEDVLKPTMIRLIGLFVTEMPLAKDACCVTRGLQQLRVCGCAQCHSFAFVDGVGDTIVEFVATAHHRRSCR